MEDNRLLREDVGLVQEDNRMLRRDNRTIQRDNRLVRRDLRLVQKDNRLLRRDNRVRRAETLELEALLHELWASRSFRLVHGVAKTWNTILVKLGLRKPSADASEGRRGTGPPVPRRGGG